jgi:hypothetical protein
MDISATVAKNATVRFVGVVFLTNVLLNNLFSNSLGKVYRVFGVDFL